MSPRTLRLTCGSSMANRNQVHQVLIDPPKVVRPSAFVSHLKAQDGAGVIS